MKTIVKTFFCSSLCFVLASCSSTATGTVESPDSSLSVSSVPVFSDNRPKGKTQGVTSAADIADDPSDPEVMAPRATDIALVYINSIDGCDNQDETTGEYVYPYTYGKLTVLQVFKGPLTDGSQISFSRMGGTVTVDAYAAGMYENEREKFLAHINPDLEYITQRFEDDIDIEVGKTYLAYMFNPEEGNVPRENEYALFGWQGGIREAADSPSVLSEESTSEIRVLNNYTGEWETLSNILPQ